MSCSVLFCQERGLDREKQIPFLFVANGAWVMRKLFQPKLRVVKPRNEAKINILA